MSRPQAMLPRLLALLSFLVQALGLVLAVLVVFELARLESRGSHVLGDMRWPVMLALSFGSCLCLVSALRDLSQKVDIRSRMLRDLLVLGVLAIAAQVLLSRNFKPILCQSSFALAIGCFAGLRLLESRRESWNAQAYCRRFEFMLCSFCASLVLLEVGLRVSARLSQSPFLARETETVEAALGRFRLPPGALHFSFPCNSGSHYDLEFAPGREATVVSIGDSFSFGVVPHLYHYTTVAERQLEGVAIHNLGYAGIGPGGYLHILENQGLDLQADLVLVNFFIGNDLFEAARWNAEPDFITSLCDRRNVLSYLLPQRLYRLATGDSGLGVLGKSEMKIQTEGEVVNDAENLLRQYPWLENPNLEPASLTAPAFLQMEVERAVLNEQADQYGGYELLFRSIDEMLGMLGEKPFCVMLIPDQYQVDDGLWDRIARVLGRSDLDRDEPQRMIGAWLRRRGISYLDLLPSLRERPPMADGERHLYHLRDTHFNARGNAVAGKALAEFLKLQLEKAGRKGAGH